MGGTGEGCEDMIKDDGIVGKEGRINQFKGLRRERH